MLFVSAVATPVPGAVVANTVNAVPLVFKHVIESEPPGVVQSPDKAGKLVACKTPPLRAGNALAGICNALEPDELGIAGINKDAAYGAVAALVPYMYVSSGVHVLPAGQT